MLPLVGQTPFSQSVSRCLSMVVWKAEATVSILAEET
jgi:hypothetical protein